MLIYPNIIKMILKLYPHLTTGGFSCSNPPENWELQEDAFRISLDLLDLVAVNKNVSVHSPSAYGLKHGAEYLSDTRGRHIYVGQGTMTAALIYRGIPVQARGGHALTAVAKSYYALQTRLIDIARDIKLEKIAVAPY